MKTVAKLREDTGKPDGGYYSRSRSQESGGNRNGGLERYLGNRIDMKWRFIFIWASKERKMPRMACRQHDPNTDSNRIHTQSLWPILTLLSGARKQGDGGGGDGNGVLIQKLLYWTLLALVLARRCCEGGSFHLDCPPTPGQTSGIPANTSRCWLPAGV